MYKISSRFLCRTANFPLKEEQAKVLIDKQHRICYNETVRIHDTKVPCVPLFWGTKGTFLLERRSLMKKLISILLSVLLLLLVISSFGVSAESTYAELWQEKRHYENAKGYIATGAENFIHRHYMEQPESHSIEVLLYTEQGKSLTYEMISSYDGGLDMVSDYLPGGYIGCAELMNIRLSCYDKQGVDDRAYISMYREVMQVLGISADELRQAYQKMQDAPESAKELLMFLSDEQFEAFLDDVRAIEMPQNFVIEAACMEDDATAEALLCIPGNVYVAEWGGSVSVVDIFGRYNELLVEFFDTIDMTTRSFAYFIEDLNTLEKSGSYLFDDDIKSPDGRTAMEKLEYLESVREAQLQAKQAGDSTVISVLVLALALPTLGVVVLAKKKRKL